MSWKSEETVVGITEKGIESMVGVAFGVMTRHRERRAERVPGKVEHKIPDEGTAKKMMEKSPKGKSSYSAK